MIEKIGGVTLDYKHYPGEDLYSDGIIEDEILNVVQNYDEDQYTKIIQDTLSWPMLYHLSYQRTNIISWYPMNKGAKVLEVGSGCGAITAALSEKAENVTCIDLSKKRSLINAYRNKKRQNIEIKVGNFIEIEQDLNHEYDIITLIGVFEYGQIYIGGEKPFHEFLGKIMKHLKPGGRLIIAIENKFGLKYFAGCQEDHVGRYFEGIEGYQNTNGVRTFSKHELEKILKECGCLNYYFYYPHPDYKFPQKIYSDHYLPKNGELDKNICNFDRKRLVLFDEGKVYNQMIQDNMYPFFANSFLVEIRKEV